MREFEPVKIKSLGEALDDVAIFDVSNMSRLCVEVEVENSALDQFEVHAKLHSAGPYRAMFASKSDFTSPKGILVGTKVSGITEDDLTKIPAGNVGILLIDIVGIQSIKIRAASSIATGSGLTVYAGAA